MSMTTTVTEPPPEPLWNRGWHANHGGLGGQVPVPAQE
jgi:hypothetical protein